MAFAGLPGGSETRIVFAGILLVFGAKRLPELSRSLGKSLGEFRKGQAEGARPDPAPKPLVSEDEA